METLLNVMLIRFAVLAGCLVVAALLLFTVALTLKRRGKLDDVRRYTDPAAKAALRAAARRLEGRTSATPRSRDRGGR
ncbi:MULTISPECIES: hypothetical protein [Streptomyces]|uniref:hypothetical protein n=1 Tax=Streptomyces TaxID=1883 RepID=UPI00094040FC|nr:MULTISPECIES: hypothetical protein [Streptomyces]MBP0937510.1 hypothetical protein [Streptomyces sp. KCTC 0041BP]OKI39524.1 hypothetical protein A6A28_03130 [Streptomyces sp. CB03578]PJN20297.1 hypothetical protein CG724_00335 [Streptomyces sp. CB02120-2]GHD63171.1 hypothetical protein GCM10010336_19760 [Streptomyces goshikiensis]